MSSLTTFVVGDGPTAAGVLALVERWTRAGILSPSLWVTPSGITEGKAGPPGVQAKHVHSSGTTTVDLFEHIGRFRLELVRVVAVHLVLHDGKAEAGLSDAAVTVSTAIDSVLPRRVDGSLLEGCRLHRALVMIPVSGATGATPEMTNPDWEVNVVISPEDRPDLDRASVFVRQPGNFEGHAATALSAIGGILRGVDVGVLDELGSDSTTADGDVIVARISIRSIVGDDLLDGLAAQILDTEALAPHGPSQLLSWARPASQPELVASAAAASILQSAEWAPTATPPQSSARPTHQGFSSALKTAVAFNLRTVGAVTSWLLSRGRVQVERSATDAIVGAKAGTLVTLGPRPVADLTRATERLLIKERARISEEMRLQATRATVPAPSTWMTLRKICFGLVDGGDLGDFPEPRQAGKRELLPASSVVVRPETQWPGSEEQVVPADDPRAMLAYKEFLATELQEVKHALASATSALKAAQTSRAENPPDEAESSDDQYWPDDQTLERLSAEVEEAQVPFDAVQLEVESYKTWFDHQASSVLWKVAADVAMRADELDAVLERISSHREGGAPPAEQLQKSQRSLVRWWSWTVSIWLTFTAVLTYAYFGPLPQSWEQLRPNTEQFIYTVVAVFVIALVILALANHGFYKAVRRYEWQLELGIDRIRQDKATFVYAGQEKARLDLLYESHRDWVRIIGEVIHHPWSPIDTQYEALPEEVVAALPAAAGLAQQADANESVDPSTLISAYDLVYSSGWSSRHFEKGYDAWEGDQSARADEGYRPIDLDTLVSSTSPRRRLREYWASGAARRMVTGRALHDLQLAVQDGTLVLPTRVVSRIGRYGDGDKYPEREFFAAMATESTTFTVEVFTAQARLSRRHYVERSIAWMPNAAQGRSYATDVDIRDCVGSTAVRVDISRRISARELLPFSEDRLLSQVDDVTARPQSPYLGEEPADGVSWH